MAIVGVTPYHGQEHPLRRRRLETVRVILETVDSGQVEATIDLGIIARRYAVPARTPEEWLEAEVFGWCEEPAIENETRGLLLDVPASPMSRSKPPDIA
jgi:hypothetical protein